MKKFWNICKIVLIALLVCCGISLVVLYITRPEYTKETLSYFWSLLNKPLPIIGVTTLAILVFVWKVVITTNYGKKKLEQYDNKVQELKQAKEDFEKQANETIAELKTKCEKLKSQIAHACELSTNQKIKNFGKELEYGKETIDSETETN